MPSYKTCGQGSVQNVYSQRTTLPNLCSNVTQLTRNQTQVGINTTLSPNLCNAYTRKYPPKHGRHNRLHRILIPTMHSPNNKNYMGNLDLNNRKGVENGNRI
jgi:hypothetical protein